MSMVTSYFLTRYADSLFQHIAQNYLSDLGSAPAQVSVKRQLERLGNFFQLYRILFIFPQAVIST